MDIAGEVGVLGLPESPRRSGRSDDGGDTGQGRRDGACTSIGDTSEAQAATLIQANFRGNQLRRQLAAEDEGEDEEYQYQNEHQRTKPVCDVLLPSLLVYTRPDERTYLTRALHGSSSILSANLDLTGMHDGLQVGAAVVRAKTERQQIAVDASREKRRDTEVATIATQIATGAASAAFAQQARGELVKHEQAAARIQSIQRGKQARRELQEQRRAATRIAAVQRGKQERRNVRARKRPEPEPEPEPRNDTESDESEEAGE
jgi:hypothetical protein